MTAGGSAFSSPAVVSLWKIVPGVGTTFVGDSAFTAMLSAYNSAAKPVDNRSIAALHIPYTVPPRVAQPDGGSCGCLAAAEEMFRIQPRPRSRIAGSTRVARWNAASTWTANMSSYRRGAKYSTRVKYVTAALLTRMSAGPSSVPSLRQGALDLLA